MNTSDFFIEEGNLIKYTGTEENVIIPDGVVCISTDAFRDCKNLLTITIPDSVTTIKYAALSWCPDLSVVKLGKGISEICNGTFRGCKNLTSINIPEGVKKIGALAFVKCYNLESVSFPSTLTQIGDFAFADCEKLNDIRMPNGVPELQFYNMFKDIKKKKNVPFNIRMYLYGDETRNSEFDKECRERIIKTPETYFSKALSQNSCVAVQRILDALGKPEEEILLRFIDLAVSEKSAEITAFLLEYKSKNYPIL